MPVNPILIGAALLGLVLGYLLGKPKYAVWQDAYFRGLFVYLILTALFVADLRFSVIPIPFRVADIVSSILFLTQLVNLYALAAGRFAPPYKPLRWRSFGKAGALFASTALLLFYLLKIMIAGTDI